MVASSKEKARIYDTETGCKVYSYEGNDLKTLILTTDMVVYVNQTEGAKINDIHFINFQRNKHVESVH